MLVMPIPTTCVRYIGASHGSVSTNTNSSSTEPSNVKFDCSKYPLMFIVFPLEWVIFCPQSRCPAPSRDASQRVALVISQVMLGCYLWPLVLTYDLTVHTDVGEILPHVSTAWSYSCLFHDRSLWFRQYSQCIFYNLHPNPNVIKLNQTRFICDANLQGLQR